MKKKCCKDANYKPCQHLGMIAERIIFDQKINYLDLFCEHCGTGIFAKVLEVHHSYKGHKK